MTVDRIPEVTPADYRPLQRLSAFGVVTSTVALAGLYALDALEVAVPFILTGVMSLVWFTLASSFIQGYPVRDKRAGREASTAEPNAPTEIDFAPILNMPVARTGWGHLYVIQFSSGTVKVGRTNQPAQRLSSHRRYGWAFGVVIVRAWISPAHDGYETTEARLIQHATSIAKGDRARREFFHGADFNRLVECAADLAAHATVTRP